MASTAGLRALILAGGSGTRLWPRSTDGRPKPFLALTGGASLLREAWRRAADLAGEGNVFVSGRASHEPLLRAELPEVPASRLVLEPVRRNTAPAIALSALAASEEAPDAVLAVLPSDQAVRDEPAFLAALRAAAAAARKHDAFVTLGIPPTRPETGFGYMEVEEGKTSAEENKNSENGEKKEEKISLKGNRGGGEAPLRVVRFVEKPPRARAAEFLAAAPGRFFWNAGIFVFRVSYLFEEMKKACPEVLKIARLAYASLKAGDSSSFKEIFSSSPSVSIDVAVMEKARSVLAVPCACGWSDLGSWEAVFEFRGGTSARNILEGPAEAVDGSGNLVLAETRPVRVVGLSDVVVVESAGGFLVMRRGASDALRRSVEEGLKR
jgi:mannose-1-phosphate guanylyltransferase/mannose-6-phosphate isomerase